MSPSNFPPEGPPDGPDHDSSMGDDGRGDDGRDTRSDRYEAPEPARAEIVPMDTTALAAVVRTEVDAGLAWARQNPRSVATFLSEIESFALRDAATAEQMYYSLRRGGKAIVGPSVRLAELAAECYGNLKAGARILSTTGEYAIAEGVAHDLERNTWISRTVARRLTDRNGRRYNDDMIVMTANAAGSLALRNAIVSVVGRRYLDPLVTKARGLVGGGTEGMAQRRTAMLEWWAKKGVSPDRVLAALGRKGAEDLSPEDLADARGFARAIADGEATVEEVFPPVDSVIERLRARRAEAQAAHPKEPPWTALAADDPARAVAQGLVDEMNAGQPPRIGIALKRCGFTKAVQMLTAPEVAVLHEAWRTVRLATERQPGSD